MSPVTKYVQFRPLFPELRHFEKMGTRHFSLIGHHLESVSRTEPVFELNLALSEERPTYEFRVNITSCNLCGRVKVPGHRTLTIEQNSSLVKLVKGF